MTKTAVTSASIEKSILKSLKGPSPGHASAARYVGAVHHEARKPDEMSQLQFWGSRLPVQRKIVKKLSPALENLPLQMQWDLWLGIWKKSRHFDVRSIVLIWMGQKKYQLLRRKNWKDVFSMVKEVDNWALSDALSAMLADILEADPPLISHYKTWNKSKNAWERRQSLVGLYCYARLRKSHYPAREALQLIEALLDDPHFYVQRAVGWTLREVDRIDPRLQKKFVQKHLHRISSTAWFATSELYPEKMRKDLVLRRKETRAKKSKASRSPS